MTTDIPAGYKLTEVGGIPGDWEIDLIKNLAAITTGDKNTQDHVDDGAYPFFVRSSTVERINSYAFDGEAVLTAGDGVGTGKIFHYINGKFDFHQRVYKISHFSDRLDGYFFYLYFSNHFYSRIMQMTAKSSVDSVRREMIANMRVPVPPMAQQRAIATALSDVDTLLAKLDALIAKKRDLKQATMQQLLSGQTRLPGFSGTWETKPFVDIFYRVNAKAHQIQTADYQDSGDFPVVDQGKDLVIGYTDRKDKRFLCPADGVIVFGDHTCIIKFVDFDFVVGADGTQILSVKNDQCAQFHAFQLEHNGIATTGYNRHFKFLKERIFLAPPIAEQTAIAAILTDMDAELAALQTRRDKTHALKQGMMQALLTGRIRLV